MRADAAVTVCPSRTRDLAAVAREADVLVAAIGRAGLVRAEYVKPGAVVVDVGMNRVEDPAAARDLGGPGGGRLQPGAGGGGPATIALVMKNPVQAARLA